MELTSAVIKRDFWPNNPTLWFLHCEIMLSEYVITDDHKYKIVFEKLPTGVKRKICDLNIFPGANKYETLKCLVIAAYKDDDKIIQMLTARTPSRVLDFIRIVGSLDGMQEINVDELSTIWMQFLPEPVRDIISLAEDLALPIRATVADKIVAAMNKNTVSESSCNLQQEVQLLSDHVVQLQRMIEKRPRCHETEECSTTDEPRATTNPDQDSEPVCYYHERFGQNAYQCKEPCKFGKTTLSNKEENENYFRKLFIFDDFYHIVKYFEEK